MHQAKRTRLDDEACLDVRSWLTQHPPHTTPNDVSQPVQLACWTKLSSTAGGGYSFGSTAGLHAYKPPQLPIDLNVGREQFVGKGEADKGDVETVMSAAAAASAPLSACDVLTFRNNLNKIFGTPLDPAASWAMDACQRGGTLFLDIVQLEQQWRGDPAAMEKFTYWGYSFEAACTGQPTADATSEFGILVRTRIGGLRLYIGAEVDCYDPATCVGVCGAKSPGLENFVELKTYKLPQHPKQQFNLWRHKHPKWWLQSFLAGVPTLALGGRDDQGIVHRVNLVRTSDLPRISASNGAGWSPQQALAFGAECLQWMQARAAAHPGQQLRFSYDGGSRVVQCQVVPDGSLPARLEAQVGAAESQGASQ